MNKTLLRLGLCMALALVGTTASAACYHVYNGRGKLVERAANPPVNMSRHLRQTVPKKYGRGATMVFESPTGTPCGSFATTRSGKQAHAVQDTEALLDNLMRLNADPRGMYSGRTDRWLADVQF